MKGADRRGEGEVRWEDPAEQERGQKQSTTENEVQGERREFRGKERALGRLGVPALCTKRVRCPAEAGQGRVGNAESPSSHHALTKFLN